MTTHAWFSAQTALRGGSSVYRKPGGATVNVTRTNDDRESKGSFVNVGPIENIEVAPTIAKLLGIEMNDTDGKPLTAALAK
jgi:hypothetical protein